MSFSRIIIDAQVFQTDAWNRGMGRYLLALIGGIYTNNPKIDLHLVLNKNLPFDKDRQYLVKKVFENIGLEYLDFMGGPSPESEQHNVGVLNVFVDANGLSNSLFILGSIFSFDYQPAFPSKTVNSCIFFDMIPLKNWATFHQYFPDRDYFARFKFLYEADTVFSISESVKNDLMSYLGFESEDVINIDGAEIPNFLSEFQPVDRKKSPKPYKYVLLPGGNSPHKNMLRAIRGFDIFNAHFGDTYKLLITSFYSDQNIKKMMSLSPNIELSGQVSEQDLHDLYAHAELVLFPSLDEGLGLPVLEAVGYDKKVVCSSIPIFKEISKDAFYFFDPYSPDSISNSLLDAVLDVHFLKYKKYSAIKNKFDWTRTAKVVLDSPIQRVVMQKNKKKLSIFVEQDGSSNLLKEVSKVIKQNYKSTNIYLFIDTLFEKEKRSDLLPFMFNYFIKTYDIADAPKRSVASSKVAIYTRRSEYTYALVKKSDSQVFVDVNPKKVVTQFIASFSPENAIEASKMLEELK